MKKILPLICLLFASNLIKAAIIADWNFDGASTIANATGFTYGQADSGINIASSSASGLHASGLTAWSFPAGNPSSGNSFSADHWAVGDYFQFSASTFGFTQITVAFDAISSATGPADFHFEYSTDGGAHFNIVNYTITHAGFTVASTTFNEDLSLVTGLNNDSTVVFRLVDADTTPEGVSDGNKIVGTGGTSKVDNFIISGTAVTDVPEPTDYGMISALGLLGICGVSTWRKHYAAKRASSDCG